MIRILILILLAFLSSSLSAQVNNAIPLDNEIEELSQAYHLDMVQKTAIKRILIKKYDMIKGIQHFKDSDFERFLVLRRSIYKGTEGSIKLTLRQEQIPYYQQETVRKRKINSIRVKELRNQGADKQQLIDAGMGIEW